MLICDLKMIMLPLQPPSQPPNYAQSSVESKFTEIFSELNELETSVDTRFNDNKALWEQNDKLTDSHTVRLE